MERIENHPRAEGETMKAFQGLAGRGEGRGRAGRRWVPSAVCRGQDRGLQCWTSGAPKPLGLGGKGSRTQSLGTGYQP